MPEPLVAPPKPEDAARSVRPPNRRPMNSKNTPKRHVFDTELIQAKLSGKAVEIWLTCPAEFADINEDSVTFRGYVEHVDTYMVKLYVPKCRRVVWVSKAQFLGAAIADAEPQKESLSACAA